MQIKDWFAIVLFALKLFKKHMKKGMGMLKRNQIFIFFFIMLLIITSIFPLVHEINVLSMNLFCIALI